jgi:pimeloyl-ACP methyl ester carboxylesterase
MSWTFPYINETQELNDTARASAPGSFVMLSNGYTHYELGGPENGGPVVLVHGLSVPYFIWDRTFEFLRNCGFRVLRYDLFGRGFSDRPRVRYDIDLFCKQLRELVDKLGLGSFTLAGLSMGGPVTASFVERYPQRAQRLVLVDPIGARSFAFPRILKVLSMPGVGELVLGLFGSGQLARNVVSDFYDPAHIEVYIERYLIQMKYKGFMRALLSTLRNGMLVDFSQVYRRVGELSIPTLLLWGRNDKTVPFDQNDVLRAAIPQVEFHAIENCGHIPQYEKPDEVNPILLEFLK